MSTIAAQDHVAPSSSVTLSTAEIVELTGYRRSADQLRELQERGFSRAYINRLGRVVLERAHYQAVCGMHVERPRPKVRMMKAPA